MRGQTGPLAWAAQRLGLPLQLGAKKISFPSHKRYEGPEESPSCDCHCKEDLGGWRRDKLRDPGILWVP